MKKVFDRVTKVRFNGSNEWYDTSIFHHLVYEREEFNGQKFDYHFDNFQEAFDWIKQGYLRNAETTETLFRRRPQIHISTASMECDGVYYTEKNFKPFDVRIEYVEKNEISLKGLSEMLKADEFCEYLKDRNITNVFIKQLTNNQKNGIIIIEREVMKNVSDKSNKYKNIGNTTFP